MNIANTMTNLAINSLLLVFLAGVSLADNYYSYQDSSTDLPLSADCSVNGTDIFSIPEGDALIINTTIYDNIKEITRMTLSFGRDVTYLVVDPPNRYVTLATSWYTLSVKPIDETIEISQPSHTFYYNFTLSVTCDGIDYPVESLIPIHETNTYTPVFSNEIYEYSLFSTFNEDLQRLIELNPIVANDNDISNTEVIFSIKDNEYFDLQYGGVIAGSLNKNHSARLIPKKSELDIAQNMEFVIYVTDLGYPPRSSNASIILKPLRIKSPTFKEPYYVGDYYLNNTFIMRSQPELDITGIGKNYKMKAVITGSEYNSYYFQTNVRENGTVSIMKNNNLPELAIYKYNYLSYILNVTYTDTTFNNYVTSGCATILIELHH